MGHGADHCILRGFDQGLLHFLKLTITIYTLDRGLPGGVKVSCILRHRSVQLILAYSWARRPAMLVAGKGRVGMF